MKGVGDYENERDPIRKRENGNSSIETANGEDEFVEKG